MIVPFSQNDMLLLLQGLRLTLWIGFCSGIVATLLGVIIALYRYLMPFPLRGLATLYVDAVRSMPLVLYLVLLFTLLPIPPFERAVIALGSFNAAFIAEIIQANISTLEANQFKAASVLGLSPFQVFTAVAFPQVLARIVPTFINQMITLLKDTSLVSLGMLELAKAGEILMERSLDSAFHVILIVGLLYFVLCTGLSVLGQLLEKKLKPWQQIENRVI